MCRIQSLARANAILEVIRERGIVTLAGISATTGLNKSTAFYLAESLVSLGYAERVGDRKGYRLGLRNLELGRAVQRRLSIAEASRPSLIRLCALSKETVNLAVPFNFDVLIVESFEGVFGIRATAYTGSRSHYHSTACGKAMLAFLDPAVRTALYSARLLTQMTPNTITQQDLLEEQLEEVRAHTFALDTEENELGAHCVAAPIWDGFGQVAGAISISGLASRLPRATLVNLAEAIIAESRIISSTLGANEARQSPVRSRTRLSATKRGEATERASLHPVGGSSREGQ